jgi:7,8-dihydropterin-6-yl-methyl-4-(beta-D-ribofuranosyl)aminobenzene 5'-phosphate synthase
MKKWAEYLILGVIILLAVGQTVYSIVKATSIPKNVPTAVLVEKLNEIGSVASLEVLPLYDAVGLNTQYRTGNGVSYLIRTLNYTILMDLGDNPENTDPSPLQANMKTAGVSMQDLNALFITNDHGDHVGGTGWWQQKSFSFGKEQPPLGDLKVYLPENLKYPGLIPVVVTSPQVIAPGIISTGAIEFKNVFPMSWMRPTANEQSLAIKVDGYGVVLITGSGYPGIQQIIVNAETAMGESVVAIIGGFHYQKSTQTKIQDDLTVMRKHSLKLLAVSPHDTDQTVLDILAKQFPDAYQLVIVGKAIKIGK